MWSAQSSRQSLPLQADVLLHHGNLQTESLCSKIGDEDRRRVLRRSNPCRGVYELAFNSCDIVHQRQATICQPTVLCKAYIQRMHTSFYDGASQCDQHMLTHHEEWVKCKCTVCLVRIR